MWLGLDEIPIQRLTIKGANKAPWCLAFSSEKDTPHWRESIAHRKNGSIDLISLNYELIVCEQQFSFLTNLIIESNNISRGCLRALVFGQGTGPWGNWVK